jgi:hypothetical protein
LAFEQGTNRILRGHGLSSLGSDDAALLEFAASGATGWPGMSFERKRKQRDRRNIFPLFCFSFVSFKERIRSDLVPHGVNSKRRAAESAVARNKEDERFAFLHSAQLENHPFSNKK